MNAPTEEEIWVAQAVGTAPTLEWPVQEGDYRLILMNADGSPGVRAQAQFAITINGLFGLGLGWLIATALVAIVGLVLLILGIRTRTRPHPDGLAGPPTQPGYGPPQRPPS